MQYLAICTCENLDTYNLEQQKLLKRIFGPSARDYARNMKMLRTNFKKIKETKIHVLNPDYVRKEAREEPIGQISWMEFCDFDSVLGTNCRGIDAINCICGVRNKSIKSNNYCRGGCEKYYRPEKDPFLTALRNQISVNEKREEIIDKMIDDLVGWLPKTQG